MGTLSYKIYSKILGGLPTIPETQLHHQTICKHVQINIYMYNHYTHEYHFHGSNRALTQRPPAKRLASKQPTS